MSVLVTWTRELGTVGSAGDSAAIARLAAARKRASEEVSLHILCISDKERPQLVTGYRYLRRAVDDSDDGRWLLYAKASILGI